MKTTKNRLMELAGVVGGAQLGTGRMTKAASYKHMKPHANEVSRVIAQLMTLNDKIEKDGPLSEEIADVIEVLDELVYNIQQDRT